MLYWSTAVDGHGKGSSTSVILSNGCDLGCFVVVVVVVDHVISSGAGGRNFRSEHRRIPFGTEIPIICAKNDVRRTDAICPKNMDTDRTASPCTCTWEAKNSVV